VQKIQKGTKPNKVWSYYIHTVCSECDTMHTIFTLYHCRVHLYYVEQQYKHNSIQ